MKYKRWQIIAMLCSIVLLVAMLLPMSAFAADKSGDSSEKTVKIGYYEDGNFQAGASKDAVKSGYSYEYLQRLQPYTNWDYKYVYGDYGDLYNKLLAGDIDILTGLAYTKDRVGIINYPTLPMGEIEYSFLKQTKSADITSDPKTIAGKKIGTLSGAMEGIVQNYLKTNNISAEIVLFDDLDKRDQALIDGDVDITIVEGTTTSAMEGIESFAEAGTSSYYAVVAKNSTDILNELNAAQASLFKADPDIMEELNEKWSRQNVISTTLTENDRAWIKVHGTFTVGYYNDFLPYSATDESGNVTGIVKDVVPELFNLLNITGVEISYKGYNTYDEMIAALNNQEIDVMFPAYSEYWSAEQNNILPTDEVISTYFDLVYRGTYPDMDSVVIALPESNKMLQAYLRVNIPNAEVKFYDTVDDCFEAVASGEVDATLINGLRTSSLLVDNTEYQDFHTAQIAGDAPLGFAARRSDSTTVEILNHALEVIDKNYALTQTYQYEEQKTMTAQQFLRENWWIVALTIFIIAAIIIFFVLRELTKNKRHLEEEKRQKQELEDANEEKLAQIEEINALNCQLEDNQVKLEENASEQEAQIEEISALNIQLENNQEKLQLAYDELAEAKEEAEAANAAKTSFLFNMSHDIRTPMNAIMGFRDLLEKHQNEPEKRQDYLNKIQDASTVLLSIINNVLEMARIEKGTLEIEEVAWSAEQFNETLYSVFQVMMKEKGISFTRQIEIQHRYVYCDSTKLREIFLNILSNAYKYTNAGGNVNMRLEEIPSGKEGWVLYKTTVTDTGIGMSEEYLPHIFEEFSREQNTTDAKVEGTGLGMPIVKRLVDMLDGTIEVSSKKGEGSTFTVTLPHRIADKTDLVEHAGVQVDPKLFKGKCILLAEDNDLNAEIAMEILGEAGFIVERAEDGKVCVDMLQKAETGYYDIILMDIQMPNMNGYEATRKIRQLENHEKANIKILAMTANAFEEDRREALRAGMNGHLAKPIDVNELMGTLAALIG